MYLAIVVSSLIVAIFILLARYYNESFVVFALSAIIPFCTISNIKTDIPTHRQAPYCTYINTDAVLFSDYEESNGELIIPSHYYVKTDWINHYVYCDEKLVISNPGKILVTREDAPQIKEGSIECQ